MNYNILNKGYTLGKLMKMLKEAKPKIQMSQKKEAYLVAESSKRNRGKPKGKKKASHPGLFRGIQKTRKNDHKIPAQDVDCFKDVSLYHKKKGYWKHDYRKYLIDLKNRKQK